MFDNYWYLFRQ